MPTRRLCKEIAATSRLAAGGLLLALLLTACGGDETPSATAGSAPATTAGAVPSAAAPASSAAAPATAAPAPAHLAGRDGELSNPDNATMVFLYYDLAGLTPPYDALVERDSRVTMAQPPDRAGQREIVRAELQAAAAAVHGIGRLRLSMAASLSPYDPTYQEFTVRALAPSSVINFDALGQKVGVKFSNGRTAQIWRVTPDEAQVIKDKLGPYGQASLDVLLEIVGVQPGPGGGTITTRIAEYELHTERSGTTLGRIEVAP